MKTFSENIVDYYIKKQIVKPEMKSIYMYGVSLILNDIISFSLILALSAVIDKFLNGIVFLTVFYFLRVRCGGFHAKKVWICRTTMLLTFMSVIAVFRMINYFDIQWSIWLINTLSVLILLPIIPVENPNKKLTAALRRKNKCQAMIITFLCYAVSITLTVIGVEEGVIISITMLSVAVLAAIGKVINENEVSI